MFSLSGMNFTVKFNQDLVNWINRAFPEKNWVCANGPISVSTKDFPDFDIIRGWDANTPNIEMKSEEMLGFECVGDADIFWDINAVDIRKIITSYCLYMTRFVSERNIYLLSLTGKLVQERQPLSGSGVSVKWTTRFAKEQGLG